MTVHPLPTLGLAAQRAVPLLTYTACTQGHEWEVRHQQGSAVVHATSRPKPSASITDRARWIPVLVGGRHLETIEEPDQWVEVFTWSCGDHLCTWERVTLKPDEGVACVHCHGTGIRREHDNMGIMRDHACWCCAGERGVPAGRHRTLGLREDMHPLQKLCWAT